MALVTMQIMKEVNSKMRTLVVQLDEQLQQELEKEDLKQLKVGGNGQSKRLEKFKQLEELLERYMEDTKPLNMNLDMEVVHNHQIHNSNNNNIPHSNNNSSNLNREEDFMVDCWVRVEWVAWEVWEVWEAWVD